MDVNSLIVLHSFRLVAVSVGADLL